MRRTSLKTFLLSLVVVSLSLYASSLAEDYFLRSTAIRFGIHFRPWNHWDYISAGLLLLFFALVGVSIMFLEKDD